MADLARRFPENPLLRPADVWPSREGLNVQLLLNPGVFRYRGRTGLLLRVAEQPLQHEGTITTPVLDPEAEGGIRILEFRRDDPLIVIPDPRGFTYNGVTYLTSMSHLRLAWSKDGVHFSVDEGPTLLGEGAYEAFGVEDSRVTEMEGRFLLTFTAVSSNGIGVGLAITQDWQTFERLGMIFPPTNKDCALFPAKIDGQYVALHRPSGVFIGGHYIWLARSPDLVHWGQHACIARTRPDMWDSVRVGAGAEPILTPKGWLEIYHGANEAHRYCLGALLLDHDDPSRVIARSREPIMEPQEPYERHGFFGEVIFTNGHLVDGDTVTLYYGASDEVICGATMSIADILASLGQ